MQKKIYKVNLKDGDTLLSMFDYLCSKVNWGESALDSDAIQCMDILFKELRKDERIIGGPKVEDKEPKEHKCTCSGCGNEHLTA